MYLDFRSDLTQVVLSVFVTIALHHFAAAAFSQRIIPARPSMFRSREGLRIVLFCAQLLLCSCMPADDEAAPFSDPPPPPVPDSDLNPDDLDSVPDPDPGMKSDIVQAGRIRREILEPVEEQLRDVLLLRVDDSYQVDDEFAKPLAQVEQDEQVEQGEQVKQVKQVEQGEQVEEVEQARDYVEASRAEAISKFLDQYDQYTKTNEEYSKKAKEDKPDKGLQNGKDRLRFLLKRTLDFELPGIVSDFNQPEYLLSSSSIDALVTAQKKITGDTDLHLLKKKISGRAQSANKNLYKFFDGLLAGLVSVSQKHDMEPEELENLRDIFQKYMKSMAKFLRIKFREAVRQNLHDGADISELNTEWGAETKDLTEITIEVSAIQITGPESFPISAADGQVTGHDGTGANRVAAVIDGAGGSSSSTSTSEARQHIPETIAQHPVPEQQNAWRDGKERAELPFMAKANDRNGPDTEKTEKRVVQKDYTQKTQEVASSVDTSKAETTNRLRSQEQQIHAPFGLFWNYAQELKTLGTGFIHHLTQKFPAPINSYPTFAAVLAIVCTVGCVLVILILCSKLLSLCCAFQQRDGSTKKRLKRAQERIKDAANTSIGGEAEDGISARMHIGKNNSSSTKNYGTLEKDEEMGLGESDECESSRGDDEDSESAGVDQTSSTLPSVNMSGSERLQMGGMLFLRIEQVQDQEEFRRQLGGRPGRGDCGVERVEVLSVCKKF
ncbi:unnamed protein product [Amoebophrya sp. A120]|nr:unnamed protein product [Amoebophrya sp. A120]|eukprot:GSA120T00021947001.1